MGPELSAASQVKRGNDPTGPSLPSGGGLSLPTFAVVDLGANSRLLGPGYVSDNPGITHVRGIDQPVLETLTTDGYMVFGEFSGKFNCRNQPYSETRYLWKWNEGIVAETTHSRAEWSLNPERFPFYFIAPLGYGGVFYGTNFAEHHIVISSDGSGIDRSAVLAEPDPATSPASLSHRFDPPEDAPNKAQPIEDTREYYSVLWDTELLGDVDVSTCVGLFFMPISGGEPTHQFLDEEYVAMSPYGEYKVLRDNQQNFHRIPGEVTLPSNHVVRAVNSRGKVLSTVAGDGSHLNGTKVSDTFFSGLNGWEDPVLWADTLWDHNTVGYKGTTTPLGDNGDIVGVDTPPEEGDSPLVIATEEGVYVPLPDVRENVGFLPPSSRANLAYVPYAELVRDRLQDGSPKWTGIEAAKMTDNGKIAARAINSETGQPHAVLLLKVDVAVDATDSSAAKLNYTLPDNVPVNRATLWYGSDDLGWTKWDEKTGLTGSGFLTFNQKYIDLIGFGDPNPIDRDLKLEFEIAGQSLEFSVNADRIERMETATELITGFWLDVGTRIFNHTIVERYHDMVYSIPASGELRQLTSSFASVDLGSSDFSAGTETHKYSPDGGSEQNMTANGNTIGGSPNLVSWSLSSQLWIDTNVTTVNEGVCKNSGINVFTGTGPALGGSTNNSVDVTIE